MGMTGPPPGSPREAFVSVVVVVYNIPREAPRTLLSLSTACQRHVRAEDYEVLVVDNGSTPPFDAGVLADLPGQFRLIRIDDAPASPAHAVNRGLAEARGEVVGVMVDGARMVTPGVVHFARRAAALYDRAVVATPGWYLGPDFQRRAIRRGFDRQAEDRLLASIDWPRDGYRLFEIGTADESAGDGCFKPLAESNALFLRRECWQALGGFDERFDAPGGGLVNLDAFRRALELPEARLVVLASEGAFHQLHGGVATNVPMKQVRAHWKEWEAQYRRLRGRPYRPARPAHPPTYVGEWRWPAVAGLGRRGARWVRQRAMAGIRRPAAWLPARAKERVLVRAARSWRRAGFREPALRCCRKALMLNPDSVEAALLRARLELPGDDYLAWLERLYGTLAPETAIEIGVFQGASLGLFRPPTLAIGIDPAPQVEAPLGPTVRLVTESSDEFFGSGRARAALGGRPLSVGFIDGLHLYEQALKDFTYLESVSGPRSLILIHDTLPRDEWTQARSPTTRFHTGDVWRLVLCLKHYRPDLEVFTIPAAPSGLTIVAGLDASSTRLADRYSEAVDRFLTMPFAEVERDKVTALNVIANDWDVVRQRLVRRGILTGA